MSNDINDALGVSQTPELPGNTQHQSKYDYLKKIANFIAILGWIMGGLIVLAGIGLAATTTRYGGAGVSFFIIIGYIFLAVLIVVSLLAQAGIIKVLVDIEENTSKK